MKKLLISLIAFLLLPLSASAVTVGWMYNSATNNIQPYPSISTTASTSVLSATTFCLTGDTCRTTWPSGGSSASSTLLSDNNTWSGTNTFSTTGTTTFNGNLALPKLGTTTVLQSSPIQPIPFINASGKISTDPLNFYYDPIGHEMYINASDNVSALGTTFLEIFHDMDVTEPQGANDVGHPVSSLSTYRGTWANSQPDNIGDILGEYRGYGYQGTSAAPTVTYFTSLQESLVGASTTSPGGQWSIMTKNDNSTAMTNDVTISSTSTTFSNLLSTPNATSTLFTCTTCWAGTLNLTTPLSISSGGTATSTQVTNGVNYFDGTRITSGAALTWTGTNFGIGAASPNGILSVITGSGNYNTATSASAQIGRSASQYIGLAGDSSANYIFGVGCGST